MAKTLIFLPTWHPAAVMRDRAKYQRGYMIHCSKAVDIALGKRIDPLPKIHRNPTEALAKKIFKRWQKKGFAGDIETPSIDDTRILSIAVSGSAKEAMVWDLRGRKKRLKALKEALADPSIVKVFHNGAFDVPILDKHSFRVENLWDTVLEANFRHPDEPANLSYVVSTVTDVAHWKHGRGKDLLFYNALDACWDWRYYQEIAKEEGEMEYVDRRMSVLSSTIIPLNTNPIRIDVKLQMRMQRELQANLASWRKRVDDHFSQQFGMKPPIGAKGSFSAKKLQEFLYTFLGLPVMTDAKTGKLTANKDVLEKLIPYDKTGSVKLLFERVQWKAGAVPINTPHVKGFINPRFVIGGDEKSEQNQIGRESPGSGRLASREPNVNNWKEWARMLIIPSKPEMWIVKADYSQIEARLITFFSKDHVLEQALAEGDIHLFVLYEIDKISNLYGLGKYSWEEIKHRYFVEKDPELRAYRDEFKRVVYGWFYRMGARKLQTVKGIPLDRGKLAIEALNHKLFRVVDWWDLVVKEVIETSEGSGLGYLTNPWGRIREFNTKDVPAICNFLPQSVAAEILFDAMEALNEYYADYNARILLPNHDETVSETDDIGRTIRHVKLAMERPIAELENLVIPVDVQVGKRWAKYHKHGVSCKDVNRCAEPENLDGCKPRREKR